MIRRGCRNELYLYEITEQDLLLIAPDNSTYTVGNILIFADKRDISLGRELAKADDFSAAIEYLETSKTLIKDNGQRLQEIIAQQAGTIKQRDNLLKDLTEDLESQRYSNQLLIAQLNQLREQVEIERLTKEEMVGDLQQVSAETYSLDTELSKTIDEKLLLEQELAARITDLLELNLQNDDLKRRLDFTKNPECGVDSLSAKSDGAKNQTPAKAAKGVLIEDLSNNGEVLTMASGKQIRIYHDFPALSKRKTGWLNGFNFGITRFLILALAIISVALITSIIATARANGVSFGEALDLILKSIGF